MSEPSIVPGKFLTVIIRDDGPMVHCGDSPSYRSVRVPLTDEQQKMMLLHNTHSSGPNEYHEAVSKCFIEN